jgi:hypothetical protein
LKFDSHFYRDPLDESNIKHMIEIAEVHYNTLWAEGEGNGIISTLIRVDISGHPPIPTGSSFQFLVQQVSLH